LHILHEYPDAAVADIGVGAEDLNLILERLPQCNG
jgi:hypothetical protein